MLLHDRVVRALLCETLNSLSDSSAFSAIWAFCFSATFFNLAHVIFFHPLLETNALAPRTDLGLGFYRNLQFDLKLIEQGRPRHDLQQTIVDALHMIVANHAQYCIMHGAYNP